MQNAWKIRTNWNETLPDLEVDRVDTRGGDPNLDMARFDFWLGSFLDTKEFRASVLGQYDGFHASRF